METAETAAFANQAHAAINNVRVLVVGQTPPPYHGQALMIKMLLDGKPSGVELYHVRMAFSGDMDQVGRFQLGKLLHLVDVICSIVYYRFRFGIRILYYPPAGPNLVPLFRDIAILLPTRWLFSKTVFHFHASGVTELIARLPFPLKWIARLAMSRPSLAIQLSDLTTPDATALGAHRILTVPNAVADEAARANFERQRRQERDPFKILYVGTVCEGKGVLVLLDACADAIQSGKNLRLDIVGSFQPSEFQDQVESRVQSLGLSDVVKLCGQLTGDEKWKKFADADVFCFPSHYHCESFPCVILEAMCFSLPVISTSWRGIPSMVQNGETGFLVGIRDPLQLSVHLQSLADNADLCLQLGRLGRKRFCEKFTTEKYIAGLRRAFLELGQ